MNRTKPHPHWRSPFMVVFAMLVFTSSAPAGCAAGGASAGRTLGSLDGGGGGSTLLIPLEQRTPAEDFTLDLVGGGRYRLASSRGQVVVIRFWATFCPGCVEELQYFEDLHRSHGQRGVVLLAINADPPITEGEVRNLVRRRNFSFNIPLDRDNDVMAVYNPKMILPYSVVVDRQGRVAVLHEASEQGSIELLEQAVERLLQEEG